MAVVCKNEISHVAVPEAKRSCFDGSVLQLIGWRLLAGLVTVLTLGIAYPWAMCMVMRWEVRHTVINGRRLKFTGRGTGLWGRYLLWGFLTVITLGIYGIWLGLGIRKWKVKHTVYEDDPETEGSFTGSAGGWLGYRVLWLLMSVFTLGIGYAWGEKKLLRWEAEHTYLGGGALTFRGTGAQLFGKYLLWTLLTVVTLGVFAFFVPVRYLRWKTAHTFALACVPEFHIRSRSHEEAALRDSVRFAQADSDTQLERVKSGIIGEESEEELRAFAEIGNRSAMCELALRLKQGEFEGEALEFLRRSALALYHPAMLDYALYTGPEQSALYSQLLEGSASKGNPHAPWLLALHYEEKAQALYQLSSYEAPDQLQRAAYWFRVAMERGDGEALANKDRYEKMLLKLALWLAERRERKHSGGGGWLLLAATVVLIAAAAVIWRVFFVKPVDTGPTEPVSKVQLWCDDRIVGEDTLLFQDVPWEPSVVSFENLTLTNNSDQTVTWKLSLEGTEGVLKAIAIGGRVSEGDMERVMAQLDSFRYAEAMDAELTVEPGQSYRFALILYWPGNADTEIPPYMVLPVQMEIHAVLEE